MLLKGRQCFSYLTCKYVSLKEHLNLQYNLTKLCAEMLVYILNIYYNTELAFPLYAVMD